MGSGKTVISKILSKKTGMKIEDTDAATEKKAGIKIKTIFKKYGEEKFRKLESAAAARASKKKNRIIATGGGIVKKKANIRALRRGGIIVYLKNTFATSKKRLEGKKNRPLFMPGHYKEAEKLYRSRLKMYREAADITVVTDKLSPAAVADKIIRKCKMLNAKR